MKTIKLFFAVILLLQTINVFGQKYIGEFNKNELPINASLHKEFDGIGHQTFIGFAEVEIPVEKLNQYITKAKPIASKCEERIRKNKEALTNLPENPNYKSTNIEYKHWTEAMIADYEGLLSVIKAQIARAEARIAEAKKQKQENELQKKKLDDDLEQRRAAEEKAKKESDKNFLDSQSSDDKHNAAGAVTGTSTTNSSANELSEKVKVNGEYVQVFRQNGVPYIKRADGSVHQTTETVYTQIEQTSHSVRNNAITSAQQEKSQVEQQKSDELLKRQETERLLAQIEHNRLQQEATNEKIEETVTGVTDMITQAMMHDSQEKERRYERDQLRRQQNDSEAYKIVNQYEKRAELGDEQAIEQMIKAQYLMSNGNPVEYMKSKRQTFGSQIATESLINHYQRIITTTDNERSGNFFSSILYFAGGAGAYFLLNSLAADAKDSDGTETGMKEIYLAGAYGLGGALTLGGIVSAIRGFSARGSEYREAVKELESIKNTTEVTFNFTPTMFKHDNRNAFGLALKINF